ncbi:ATP-binding protein [uncultured Desulfuromonas sp.]|uniref:sensor histidine kinase n=1 Tax=uncultured Desulfuromonas sp. TaxID=181013 RepID=UPI002AAC095F|nr:ATP-binding protein [uncultured Desulfuromonas sp.]
MALRFSLLVKFMAVISTVLLITMFISVVVNVRFQRQITLENSLHEADYFSETILRSTYYQMLEDDREMLYQMIDEVGAMPGIRRIRLFNKEGIINFSTDKQEVGTIIQHNSEGCSICHLDTGEPLAYAPTAARGRTFYDENGEIFLGVTKAIYNDPSCYTAECHYHPQDRELNGILDVQISLKNRMAQVDIFRNYFVILTCVLLVLLFVALLLLTKRLIISPVSVLIEHQRRISAGDLSSMIEDAPNDELGELARGANQMTRSLRASQAEIRNWANTLEAKVEERTQQIQKMQGTLARSERLASLGKLVAGIAHEINNPLTGILMFSSMAAETPGISEQMKKDLDTITQETQRCAGIVRGLLDFGRESIPMKTYVSVNTILDKTLALVENQTLFQNVEITREYDGQIPELEGDPNQLEQVFMNIFINAAQAMLAGGRLAIKTWFDDDMVMIRIADTGCGISGENLERIFDPFFTTKDQQGTGLGLSVSYGIVENHGGDIRVESCPAKGTAFTIRLPVNGNEKGLSVPPTK